MSHHARPSQPVAPIRASHDHLWAPAVRDSVHDACPSIHNARPWSTQILCRYMHLSSIPIPYIRPALCKCSFRLNIDSALTLRLPISLTPISLPSLRESLRIHPSRAFGPLRGCGPPCGHCPAPSRQSLACSGQPLSIPDHPS